MRTFPYGLYFYLSTQPNFACRFWDELAAFLFCAEDEREDTIGTEKPQWSMLDSIGFETDFAQAFALIMQHIERLTFPPGTGCLG
jgi:hypothetical protein